MTQHITGEILGQSVHVDTLYYAWASMAVILAVAIFLSAGLSNDPEKYGARQLISEGLYSFFASLVRDQIGKRGERYIALIGSIFIFILVNYYAGLLPWKLGEFFPWWPKLPSEHGAHAAGAHTTATAHAVEAHGAAVAEHVHSASESVASHAAHIWHGASTCADINVPAALAILVVVIYFFSGAMIGGWKYIQMFLPINYNKGKGISLNLMCLIEIMDLAIRPLTLTLRLFANTVAGETLLATFIGLVALVLPIVVLGFEIFVGVLQAFLFTILTCVYVGGAVQHAEHLIHDEHH